MAQSYVLTGSTAGVQVLSTTSVVRVQYAEAVTRPSNIDFVFPIPLDLWAQNEGYDYLQEIASQIEQMISEGLAVGGSYIQEPDETGLLVDYMDFVVEYRPPSVGQGVFSTVVRVPLNTLLAGIDPFFAALPGGAASLLSASLDRLRAMAAR
jgi:hypothetical protein